MELHGRRIVEWVKGKNMHISRIYGDVDVGIGEDKGYRRYDTSYVTNGNLIS